MDPIVRYYLNQAGRGKNNDIGPVYATPLVLNGLRNWQFFGRNLMRRQTYPLERCQSPRTRNVAYGRRYIERHSPLVVRPKS